MLIGPKSVPQCLLLRAGTGLKQVGDARNVSHKLLEDTDATVPAVFNRGCCICVLLLQECPGPVDVIAIQPVMIDAERVLQIMHSMMPPAGHKDGLSSLLQQYQHVLTCCHSSYAF